tara:strand:- start:12 stop:914 length:903 start_codon:yes stop_codon:yes gene_type:complete
MRLGISPNIKVPRRNGFFQADGKYYSKATTSDFDDITDLTIVMFLSGVRTGATLEPMGDVFGIYQDTTNDLGFRTYVRGGTIALSMMGTADGSGGMTLIMNDDSNIPDGDDAEDIIYGRFSGIGGLPGDTESYHSHQSGTINMCLVGQFQASATNDTKVLSINSQGIAYHEGNAGVANLGTMGTSGEIRAGHNAFASIQAGNVIHKVAIWDSALTEANISNLVGRTVTFADSIVTDGNFRDTTRWARNYSKVSVTDPTWEWDFSALWEKNAYLGNIVDQEGSAHTLVATGSPSIGTFRVA